MLPENGEIRRLLAATWEEIHDGAGNTLGCAAQPARFKVERPYLARGGFLVVEYDEASGEYIGTEFDALLHPKTREPYPAGHSERVWRARTLEDAYQLVITYQ
ncbi:MAG TPA: hypothetical protein VD969_25540 [Symbiobacteriaceae bacterium]|nr:hypothetical protein [Symbiobacteriaceae bacterium]